MTDLQPQAVQNLRNKYEGRVFIFGNGPSLLEQDLSIISDPTFVCNSWFRWEKAFTPTFFAMNWVEWVNGRIDPVPDPSWTESGLCFLLNSGHQSRRPGRGWVQVWKSNYDSAMLPEFAGLNAPLRRIPSSATSPLVMACLAIWMGFRDICFLGVDTTSGYMYDETAYRRAFVDRIGGKRWKRFGQYFRQRGVQITDCTPEGRLNHLLGYRPLEKVVREKVRA